jgi:hypothetical protein
MTADDFRSLALALPEAVESSHMGHPDFRVKNKIFATLWLDGEWGVVKLTPAQQTQYVQAEPEVFVPVKGGWGRQGSTQVNLPSAKEKSVCQALLAAWRNAAPKLLARQVETQ